MRPLGHDNLAHVDRPRGFSLVELLIVIAITGVLAAAAVPSFVSIIKGQRVKGMATDLFMSLTRARSEAIKLNADVTLSPVTASHWESGWRIANPGNAGSYFESHSSVDSALLSNGTVAIPASVVYQSSGRISGTVAPSFDIFASGTTTTRCVSVDLSGRPYVKGASC